MNDDMQTAIHQTMNNALTDAPRRTRMDRRSFRTAGETSDSGNVLAPVNELVPLDKEIQDSALRFSIMVQNLQKSERTLRDENGDLKARIEQYESRVTELQSALVSAGAKFDAAQAAQVRLAAILENIGGLVSDALDQGQ